MAPEIPEDAQDLIRKLLVLNSEDRLGARNIGDLIAHPYFKDIKLGEIKD